MLFNFRTFLRSWTPGKPQECHCRTWYKENTGHLFSHVRQILPVVCSSSLSLSFSLSLSLSSGQVSYPSQEGCVCVSLSLSRSLSLSLSSGQVSYPSQEGCVCVHPDSKLRVFGVSSR